MEQNKSTGEVWLSLRTSGARDLKKYRLATKQANRILRTLARKRKHGYVSLDHYSVQGIYEPTIELKQGQDVISAARVRKTLLTLKEQREDREFKARSQAEARRSLAGRTRLRTTLMSFQLGSLSQAVVIFCPITGIVGKLEMPFAPIALTYEHPLAEAGNVLTLLRWYFSPIAQKEEINYLKQFSTFRIDRQILAGCLMSLLKRRGLLDDSTERETSAVERNMVLQNAGHGTLSDLLKAIVEKWDNPNVWKRMPRLSLDWKTHSPIDSTVTNTLQHYLKVLNGVLEPIEFTSEERAKLFTATATKPKTRVKIYSAATVEHRKIKESKTEAYELFEAIEQKLSIAHRIAVKRTLRDLLLLPASVKAKTALILRALESDLATRSKAAKLADLIMAASNEELMKEATHSFIRDEVSPIPAKSIAEILALKKARKEDKENKDVSQETTND